MIKSSEQGGGGMDKTARIKFLLTPNMGFELHDKLGHTIVTTSTQYCSDLRIYLGHQLIYSRLHPQISVDHTTEQLESRTMRVDWMEHNKMFFGGIKRNPICPASFVYISAATLQSPLNFGNRL